MSIRLQDLGKSVRDTQYAVRGPVVARAQQLEREGRDIIYCNIGNPQALEQRPLTYLRQVLALCQYPDLIERAATLFPPDALETARRILKGTRHGLGAYSDSKGVRFIREAVAEFICARDGIRADAEAIYLTDGASKGVQTALRILLSGPDDGIMIPIPQYPLYSATIGPRTAYSVSRTALPMSFSWIVMMSPLEAQILPETPGGINGGATRGLLPRDSSRIGPRYTWVGSGSQAATADRREPGSLSRGINVPGFGRCPRAR